jgi:DNA-binding LacI/PurR family transcriptional regulator
MGYDDILLASMFNPPISTVSIPIGQLGTAAVDMVCRIITGETVSDLHFAPTLTLRATT